MIQVWYALRLYADTEQTKLRYQDHLLIQNLPPHFTKYARYTCSKCLYDGYTLWIAASFTRSEANSWDNISVSMARWLGRITSWLLLPCRRTVSAWWRNGPNEHHPLVEWKGEAGCFIISRTIHLALSLASRRAAVGVLRFFNQWELLERIIQSIQLSYSCKSQCVNGVPTPYLVRWCWRRAQWPSYHYHFLVVKSCSM